MMKVGVAALTALLACASAPAAATTWGDDKIKDPVTGRSCKVQSPMSSGSYIYHWPEKYEQVFWPLTDRNGIWVCPGSGFAAFIGDIDLDDAEKSRISDFLRDAPPLPKNPEAAQILERLESVYGLRTLDPDERSRILRALAHHHEVTGSQGNADALRRQAGVIMEDRLADAGLEPELRLQYLFVTANYAREFGRTDEADSKFEQLSSLLTEVADGDALNGYAQYLRELMASARTISPGGVLAPGP